MTSSAASRYDRAIADVLVDAIQELSRAQRMTDVQAVVRDAARRVSGADGVTFILSEGDLCHYVDEAAIAPLWKGSRFPKDICVSGWVMDNRTPAVIPDIYADDRVPDDIYEPTFVRSLAVVPIRASDPVGAIGAYWSEKRDVSESEVRALQALASSTAVSIENVRLVEELERHVTHRSGSGHRDSSALEHFATVASHDLRGPVATIQMLLDTLLHAGDELSSSTRELIERASAQAGASLTSIDALLSLARHETGHASHRPVDIDALLTDVEYAVAAQLAATDVTIERGPLDPVRGDRALLRLLLQNLLSNAVKFRHPDRPAHVRVEAQRTADGVELSVTDNGRGIDAGDAERIFDLYARGRDSETEGAGIGLATCRRIVEKHGGAIRAEPLPEGVRFVVSLPGDG